MRPGAPLEVKRGYWLLPTEFTQRQQQVDRGSVKDELARRKRSQVAARRARGFDIAARVTAVLAGMGLGYGIARSIKKQPGDEQSTTTGVLAAGGVNLGLSIAFGFAAEGTFVTAVDDYNRDSSPPESDGDESEP